MTGYVEDFHRLTDAKWERIQGVSGLPDGARAECDLALKNYLRARHAAKSRKHEKQLVKEMERLSETLLSVKDRMRVLNDLGPEAQDVLYKASKQSGYDINHYKTEITNLLNLVWMAERAIPIPKPNGYPRFPRQFLAKQCADVLTKYGIAITAEEGKAFVDLIDAVMQAAGDDNLKNTTSRDVARAFLEEDK
jgi:hypothetical protein